MRSQRLLLTRPSLFYPFGFLNALVIPHQIPGHAATIATTSAPRLNLALLCSFGFHQRLHLGADLFQPTDNQRFLLPLGG
jgi:hypothetical protein